MASSLSPSAIHQIIVLLESDDRPGSKKKKKRTRAGDWIAEFELPEVNRRWEKVYKLYRYTKPRPPLDYLDSLELALVLKGEVDEEGVRAIFAHGKPLVFWGCPRLFVSKILEAFNALQKEPTYLCVTIIALCRLGVNRLSEVWPQAYRTHLPCYACTTVETVEESSITRRRFRRIDLATLLLLPEFALEALDFLDRAHIGSSLLANRRLHNLICQLRQRLSVHRLTCGLDKEFLGTGWVLTVRHRQRDLSYTDVRRFRLPSTAGAANDCTLIRNYLSNSHVADLRLPPKASDVVLFPFAIKMLAACNVSVGRAELRSWDQRLSDYRSLDAIFGGLLMSELYLCCAEHRFVELVKTTDFFRLSTIQGLRELKLYLAFERGEITDTVEHFQFKLTSSKGMNFAFNRDNLLVSGMKVEGTDEEDSFPDIEWDVYRFRNAITSEYLTACVGRTSSDSVDNTLHIVKGEFSPDISFADVFDF